MPDNHFPPQPNSDKPKVSRLLTRLNLGQNVVPDAEATQPETPVQTPPSSTMPGPAPKQDAPTVKRALPVMPLASPNPTRPRRRPAFSTSSTAILHFAQAGTAVTLRVNQPIVLGRGTSFDLDEKLDLTDFGAYTLGVSRNHCQLKRGKYHLTVTDLGSANGTFLNDERLLPNTSYSIEHGDLLRLGSMAITILFNANHAI